MDPQITAALVALGVTVIGALGTFVKLLLDKLGAELRQNTRLTVEARNAANGSLRDALAQLAAARNQVLGLRVLLREREDRIAYILARHPDVESTLAAYRDRRTSRATQADELRAEQRLLHVFGDPEVFGDPDDPTGTDAGAHPNG